MERFESVRSMLGAAKDRYKRARLLRRMVLSCCAVLAEPYAAGLTVVRAHKSRGVPRPKYKFVLNSEYTCTELGVHLYQGGGGSVLRVAALLASAAALVAAQGPLSPYALLRDVRYWHSLRCYLPTLCSAVSGTGIAYGMLLV
eukprot:3510592-Rhodomonas_salina.1